jgi:arylsulfatase A-like enzyme
MSLLCPFTRRPLSVFSWPMRKSKFLAGVSSSLVCVLCLFLSCSTTTAQRPNIIVILVDDMGYSDLGCYGSTISTPNIDQLAAQGVRFRQAYNSAKCEPTRTCLLSGQWWQDVKYGIQRGPTIGNVMQSAGYRTLALGKWHLKGTPVDRGFDRYFGHLSGASDFFLGNDTYRLDGEKFMVPQDGSFYATDAFADYAIDFIEQSRKEAPDKPFFMYLAFNAPHWPLHARPEDVARYKGKFNAGWDKMHAQRISAMQKMGILDANWPTAERPDTIPAWDTLSNEEQASETDRMEVYAAMIDRVDHAVGRVTDALEQQDIDEDTLIIFLSDNGANPYERRKGKLNEPGSNWYQGLGWAWMSNSPARHYKRNMHMGGALTSMVVHWPAELKQTGTISDEPVHIVDFLPTFLDLAGKSGSYPSEWEGEKTPKPPGRSMAPLLTGGEVGKRGALYFHLYDHRAVILNGYKLVSDWGRPWGLYNLAADRFETNDLSKQMPEKAKVLAALWEEWAKQHAIKLKSEGGEQKYRRKGPKDKP